ncbi:MAG: arginine--tRNA ligase [Candidatus Nomurabacteria bacterium]|jgi:arginyl-tRNA synthetase|nr:arginine--tRNA ligase [Candidatus Nomurabacteria bacterium]
MENLKTQISNTIKDLYNITDLPIELSPAPDDVTGDYATNIALRLAKTVGKPPHQIAEAIISKLAQTNPDINSAIAGAGFINITIKSSQLMHELDAKWSEKYGENTSGAGQRAIVEFPSQNMAKPYSVGHLRPGNQGWAVKNLLEASGWAVITDNHLGDSGTPFGIWATGFTRSGKSLDRVTVYELGEIYIEMKRLLKDESESSATPLKDAVQDWLLKLENKDPAAVKLSTRFNEISLKHIHEIMTRLSISTDYELGESFFLEQGKALVQKYLQAGIFQQNPDGSIICPLDDQGIDVPLLVLKSNGAALYATTDLATMVYRAQEFHPDQVVYCVGVEQKFYFEQLFAMGKKLHLPQANIHLWFGTIDQLTDGKREKMSSRKGVVLMEELLNRAEATARDITKDRAVSDADIQKIAVGAIKFTDFIADRKTNILFDWDKIFALTGFSGPFCQYAAVRMNKIIVQNSHTEATDYSTYDWEAEKPLIKLLLEYPDTVRLATDKLEAHRIATYIFRLAQAFNRYYETTPVSQATPAEKSARLSLLQKLSQTFTHSLRLLGIETPTKM